MKLSQNHRRVFVGLFVSIAVVCLTCVPVLAQCPLCKLAVENSTQGKAMGRGLNLGILVLLIPPVSVFCSIFIFALKYRNAPKG